MTAASTVAVKRNPHLFFVADEVPTAPGLRSSRCLACGAHGLGVLAVCPACLGRALEVVAAGKVAFVVDASIVHNPAGGFAAPYTIATLRTEEGMTLFAPLVGNDGPVPTGTRVAFEIIEHADGSVGFAYRVRRE